MYLGRYYHTLEEKGRVSLPRKFRKADSEQFVITRGLDGGLFIFSPEEWQKQIGSLSEGSFTHKTNRDFIRLMTNDAQEVETDKLGRILIPEYLIKFAQLTKQVVIVGSFNKIEIWNVEQYHQYIDAIEQNAESISESITPAQERTA